MKRRITLLIDAGINLVLAVLLLSFSTGTADFFGVPSADISFYPNILGAVFLGITTALIIEAYRKPSNNNSIGLGLIGAVCINMSGGLVLLFWLVFGNLELPVKGNIFLWTLDIILLVVSIIEFVNILKKTEFKHE